jgi:hypothetical protein
VHSVLGSVTVLRTKLGNAPYHSYTLYNEYKAELVRSLYQW